MSEELLGYVQRIFEDFDKTIDKLRKLPDKAKFKSRKLLRMLDEADIFGKDSSKFLQCLDELNDEVGHAGWEVLEIELRRQGVITSDKNKNPISLPDTPKGVQPQQIIQVGEQSQKTGGWTGYFASRRWAKVMEDYLKWKEAGLRATPDIATGKEVLDILEFGRQLTPEINATLDYYRQSIDHLFFFNDEHTQERCRSELRTHLSKICGIIRAFTQTSVDHRIENVGGHKRAVATSIISLQMAQYSAMGGITQSDLYKFVREASGDQDAGA